MIPAGVMSTLEIRRFAISSSEITPVPKLSTINETGCATPIA